MTKYQALYELAELASTVINLAHPNDDFPCELFTWAETLKNEAINTEPSISGSSYSGNYLLANDWVMRRA